jgi:hypothetical protein
LKPVFRGEDEQDGAGLTDGKFKPAGQIVRRSTNDISNLEKQLTGVVNRGLNIED